MVRGSRAVAAAMLVGLVACTTTPAASPAPSPTAAATPASSSAVRPVDATAVQAEVERQIAAGGAGFQTVEAVLVSVDGQEVVSLYRNGSRPDDAAHVWSVTKSVTSALVGIAIDEGLLEGLDATLADLLPAQRRNMDADLAAVTLRQLMTMTAGFTDERQDPEQIFDVLDQDEDAVGYLLRRGLEDPPGRRFAYSSSSAHLVTAVLAAALERADGTGARTVLDYAQEKLFDPLGIDAGDAWSGHVTEDDHAAFDQAGRAWGTDADGVNSGCCLLRLTPADLVRLGELYLDDGTWRGRQVLPKGWVAASTTPGPTTSQYGLMWWLGRSPAGGPEYTARGALGQLVLVAPEDRLVVAVTSAPQDGVATSDEDVLSLVETAVLPAFA